MKGYAKIGEIKSYQLFDGTIVKERASRAPVYILCLFIVIVSSLYFTKFDFERVILNGFKFWDILFRFFPPDLSFFSKAMPDLFDTIKMSLIGSFLGAILVVPLSILASSNMVPNRIINLLMRFILTFIRTLPTIVTALIATYVFGLGTLAGTIAIFLFSFSYIGKQLFEQIETMNMGPFEASLAMGMSIPKAFLVSIVPQILPIYCATTLYNFEGNVRYASILGYVGAGGIGMILNEKLGWREYSNVGMILFMLLVTVILIESFSGIVRRRLM